MVDPMVDPIGEAREADRVVPWRPGGVAGGPSLSSRLSTERELVVGDYRWGPWWWECVC